MSQTVRAKFHCNFNANDCIYLSPVYSGSEENAQFFKATPGGQITLCIVNEAAAARFIVGQEYYVDFVSVE